MKKIPCNKENKQRTGLAAVHIDSKQMSKQALSTTGQHLYVKK